MPAGEIARTFGVDWPHLMAQMISFSIVCALLYWLAYTPVLKMLDARRRQIAQGLENTQKINAALAAIDAQKQEILAGARTDAARIIDDARGVAKRLAEQEAQRATTLGQQIVAKAREDAIGEHTRMMADLRREAAHLVVETTAAVTGKVLTDEDQRRLAAEAAEHLKAA